jgi:hypothetical protein
MILNFIAGFSPTLLFMFNTLTTIFCCVFAEEAVAKLIPVVVNFAQCQTSDEMRADAANVSSVFITLFILQKWIRFY